MIKGKKINIEFCKQCNLNRNYFTFACYKFKININNNKNDI